MSEAIEEITTPDGYHAEIVYDTDAGNPRTEYDDTVCVLTQLSDRYSQPDEGWNGLIVGAWRRGTGYKGNGAVVHNTELVERYARAYLGAVAVAWWDDPRGESRIFGYLTRETAEAEGIRDPAHYLAGELITYAAWCEGEVFGYVVESPDGDTIDSCFGYYGDRELEYIRAKIDEAIYAERDRRHKAAQELFRRTVGAYRSVPVS